MMNNIKRYDAYFTFNRISAQEQDEIREIVASQGLEVDIYENALEFSFEGRDLSDQVVRAFCEIALILGEADGELRCEIDDEGQDPHFEFFTIAESKLWRQYGKIIRSGREKVTVTKTG